MASITVCYSGMSLYPTELFGVFLLISVLACCHETMLSLKHNKHYIPVRLMGTSPTASDWRL